MGLDVYKIRNITSKKKSITEIRMQIRMSDNILKYRLRK